MGWFVVLVAGLLATLSVGAVEKRPTPIKISAHAYYVQGVAGLAGRANRNFISNAGFVLTKDGVVVFDALGSPPIARELIAEIRKLTSAPIRRVIVSHYHADHIYGLQEFKAVGAEIWAHRGALEYLSSETAQARLTATRHELAPHVDERTVIVHPDRWLEKSERFELGGVRFHVLHAGPAHTPEDLLLHIENDGVVFAGDLVFRGRVPFVGTADSRAWLASLDALIALAPRAIVPGHGPVSTEPLKDLALTRDYLSFVREAMRRAAANMEPFDDAYRATDWSRFKGLPLFDVANRSNAYNTYLLMERETLGK
jgi:glyoxylase-like metal-dependent hydrolase (beta-lactamase superfamily II)